MVTINSEQAFTGAGKNICLPNTKVLFVAAVSNPSKLKKLRNWAALNAVLLPSFLTNMLVFK